MRTILWVAAATTGLVTFAAPAAQAADRTVTVFGHDLESAGVIYNSGGCDSWSADPITPSVEDVYAAYRRPGTIGSHAIGWQFGAAGGTTGNEAGPLAFVQSPGSLRTVTFSAYLPNGTADTHDGELVAYLDGTGTFTDDYYAGSIGLDGNVSGWNTWTSSTGLASKNLSWLHWTGTGWQDDDGDGRADVTSATIKDLATTLGGSTRGFVGPELGCTGQTWYADNLEITTSAGTTTYDFEGRDTASLIAGWRKRSDPVNKIVYDIRHFTRTYGETDWIGAYTAYFNDIDDGTNAIDDVMFFAGQGTLYARRYGSGSWRRVEAKSFNESHGAAFKLHFTKHTDYQFRYAGSNELMPNSSPVLSVDVHAKVKGKLLNKTVFKGAALAVSGTRSPGDKGVKVFLQRRIGGRWHTIGTTRTKGHGAFRVGAKASSTGVWQLRLEVAAGKGNLGTVSKSFSLTVKKRPAPPPKTTFEPEPPSPCTVCGGDAPDIPIQGRGADRGQDVSRALASALEKLRHGGQRDIPARIPPQDLKATLPRRLPGA